MSVGSSANITPSFSMDSGETENNYQLEILLETKLEALTWWENQISMVIELSNQAIFSSNNLDRRAFPNPFTLESNLGCCQYGRVGKRDSRS